MTQVDLSAARQKMTQRPWVEEPPWLGPHHLLGAKCEKMEFPKLIDLSQITDFMDAIILPFIGGIALLLAKFRVGDAARWHERQFLAVLVVMSIVTLRTVIYCDEVWLVHTTALGALIIASLMIPSQEEACVVV
jgi:hypothetical protein